MMGTQNSEAYRLQENFEYDNNLMLFLNKELNLQAGRLFIPVGALGKFEKNYHILGKYTSFS